jgi:hypothetical protein
MIARQYRLVVRPEGGEPLKRNLTRDGHEGAEAPLLRNIRGRSQSSS